MKYFFAATTIILAVACGVLWAERPGDCVSPNEENPCQDEYFNPNHYSHIKCEDYRQELLVDMSGYVACRCRG